MGILTSALSELVDGLIDAGINQLDAYVSREFQEGRDERAFQAIDAWENQVAQNYGLANKVAAGTYNMPGMDLAGGAGQGILPTGVDEQSLMQSFSNVPPVPPEIAKSNAAFQIFNQRYSDVLANNPASIQQEIQRKAQENRLGLVKEMAGTGFQQNQMGWGETLGAFDSPDTYSLPREERLNRLGQREGALTTGRMAAQEPFKQSAFNRSVQLKQTPGARAIGTGGNDVTGGPLSSVTVGEIGRFEKMLSGNKAYSFEDAYGKKQLNERGMDVMNRASEILGTMKKKNPLKAYKMAVDQEKAEFNALPVERRMEVMGRPRLGVGSQIQPESGNVPKDVRQSRERGAVMPVPGESLYNRTPQAPVTQPQPRPQPQNQSALTPQQINTIDIQVRNADPVTREQYRQKLKARGIDPSLIPSLR